MIDKFLSSKSTKFWILLTFILHNLYYLRIIGTQVDEYVHIDGVELTIVKIKNILNGSAFNTYLNYSDIEFYGWLYEIQAYYFSNIPKLVSLVKNFSFITNKQDAIYYLRHVYLLFYVVILLFLITKIIEKLENKNFSNLFLILLLINPIFLGHSLFNHKDITFALHLFLSFLIMYYYLYIYLIKQKCPSNIMRILFLILIIYPIGLRFNAIAFILIYIIALLFMNSKYLNFNFFKYELIKISFLSFLIIILFNLPGWPDLIYYFKSQYNTQFKLYWQGYTLINGENYFSLDFKFSYLLKVFLYKLPIPILIFSICGLLFSKKLNNNLNQVFSIFFLLFIICFWLYKPTYYDYFRQYLFTIPIFTILSVYFLHYFKFKKNKTNNFLIFTTIFFCILSQTGLAEAKYIYLNEFVNEKNISKTIEDCESNLLFCGDWSTDYYGISGKNLILKLQDDQVSLVYSCFYGHIVEDFLYKESSLIDDENDFILNEFNLVLNNEDLIDIINLNSKIEFYVINFQRFNNNQSGCIQNFNKKYDCNLYYEESKNLRGTKINLSYIFKCS